ncbi:MAG: hypothetical protein ACLS58_07310 [Sutterella wadsworthensis]
MVVNELTSSVQAKGTKTVIAATVASLVAGGAIAKEIPYEQASGNSGYSATTAENLQMEFEADNVLNMTITGKVDTRAYGLLATGADSVYTNKGTINLNLAADENATQAYRVKGMMADNNGTAVNEGTITVRNAYGMTVGSTGKNTITNTGRLMSSPALPSRSDGHSRLRSGRPTPSPRTRARSRLLPAPSASS